MKVLALGFGSFDNHKTNPAEELVNLLKSKHADIETFICSGYKNIDDNLERLIVSTKPDVVLMFGLAARTPYVRLEKVAKRPRNVQGVEQYTANLPLHALYDALKHEEIEVQYSDSAGAFWCNYIFYRAGQLQDKYTFSYGFIHIPYPAKYQRAYGKEPNLLQLGETVLGSALS